jgi:replicative DNA helicase
LAPASRRMITWQRSQAFGPLGGGDVLGPRHLYLSLATFTLERVSLERRRRVFRAMRDLREAGENIDSVTVADLLRQVHGQSQDGPSFLVSLDDGMPHAPHLQDWLHIVRRRRILRLTIVESARVAF